MTWPDEGGFFAVTLRRRPPCASFPSRRRTMGARRRCTIPIAGPLLTDYDLYLLSEGRHFTS